MEELIELREYVVKEKEKASSLIKFTKAIDPESVWIKANKRAELAFSDIIERLDLILNNSVVKPSERRSPTDENFSGCKPPDERQNPQEVLRCRCIISPNVRVLYVRCGLKKRDFSVITK
jgi:hypothetical protein